MQYFDPFHLTAKKPGVSKKAQVLQKKPYSYGKYAFSPQMVRESVQTLRSSGYKVFPPNELPQPSTDVAVVSLPINFNTGITQLNYGGGGTVFKDIGSFWTQYIHNLFNDVWNVENPTAFEMTIDVLSINFTGSLNVNNPYMGNGPEIYFDEWQDNLLPWFLDPASVVSGYGANIEYSAFDNTHIARSYDIAVGENQRYGRTWYADKKEFTDIISLKQIQFTGLDSFEYVKNKAWVNLGNPFFYAIYEEDNQAGYLPMVFSESYCMCNVTAAVEFQIPFQ